MPAETSPPSRQHRGNRRDDAARIAVLHAADDLLVERGFGALTVDAIARRAGVARQTIYRWWPSKVEILLDTLIEDSEKRFPVPEGEPTVGEVRDYLRAFARFLDDDPAGKVLLALLAEAQHSPGTAAVLRERYLAPRRTLERDMLTAGAFTLRLTPDATMDALTGPIVYGAMIDAPVGPELIDTLAESLLTPR
ncbi:TetR/AcrR family transcriptional regulator [Catenuloplanes japonicus]|uniref:TetR/AcrR family transcriptional regulator n=1 Tax=Catenuloplanes japonicus TaxID=33876 RepID=UPI000524CC8F|nr:TetR/AcrR family transcriptional regulator [Catenuloplanes japonicus]